MSSQLEHGSYQDRAAAIARDITVAVASTLEKPVLDDQTYSENYGKGLAKIYDTVYAAALKSLSR